LRQATFRASKASTSGLLQESVFRLVVNYAGLNLAAVEISDQNHQALLPFDFSSESCTRIASRHKKHLSVTNRLGRLPRKYLLMADRPSALLPYSCPYQLRRTLERLMACLCERDIC
jgi:hypothetical protein